MKTKINSIGITCIAGLLSLLVSPARAQCTNCTSTLSGTVTAAQTVGPGQTLCISPSGILQGNITINGGIVCNSGNISGATITINSGMLTSSGTITSPMVNISSGTLENSGTASVDSLSGFGANMQFTNTGIYSGNGFRMEIISPTTSPTTLFFHNAGSMTISNNMWLNEVEGTNTGDITTGGDFENISQEVFIGNFTNSGPLTVGDLFGNLGVFHTTCRVMVTGWFTNLGIVTGPLTPSAPCAGFSVGGVAQNYNYFGQDGSYLDMCAGINQNLGLFGANVSNCQCNSTCTSTLAVNENHPANETVAAFPNPVQNELHLRIEEPGDFKVNIFATDGKLIFSGACTGQQEHFVISAAAWAPGIYQLVLASEEKVLVQKIIRN
ncbi:MAG: hypothetical protein FD123_372 [Bacteroidetes bacterium]|nr:MAG: hypothetical protein FD123_372 [Bacteroidota bacterium]